MSGRNGSGRSGGSRYGTPPHFAHTKKRRSENVEITMRRALAVSINNVMLVRRCYELVDHKKCDDFFLRKNLDFGGCRAYLSMGMMEGVGTPLVSNSMFLEAFGRRLTHGNATDASAVPAARPHAAPLAAPAPAHAAANGQHRRLPDTARHSPADREGRAPPRTSET